jgi:hypothetical protein
LGVDFNADGEKAIYLNGMTIRINEYQQNSSNLPLLHMEMDPMVFDKNIDIARQVLLSLYEKEIERFYFTVKFADDVVIAAGDFKVSSRLSIHGIKPSPLRPLLYEYKQVVFSISMENRALKSSSKTQRSSPHFTVSFLLSNHDMIPLFEIIEILFDSQILELQP